MTAAVSEIGGRPRAGLRLHGISKTFGPVRVLHDAALEIAPGEIRALVGRNGSGKSTLIKILAGFHTPDPGGSLEIAGATVDLPLQPGSGRDLGISFVHQDLALAADASILDNVLVGRFATGFAGHIRWRRERKRVAEALRVFGVEADPNLPVRSLGQVDRALVAIVRSLLELPVDGGVLVLDEPTAFLPDGDVHRLFKAVREVAARGAAVVYVSHRLDEVLELADSVTVLRDGRVVATEAVAGLGEDRLVELILGQRLTTFYPTTHAPGEDVVLAGRDLTGDVVRDLSLTVARGEIVGLAGLNGSGFEELPYLLFGALRARGGTVSVGGEEHDATGWTPEHAVAAGLALLPADRATASGVPSLTVSANVTLPTLGRHFSGGRLHHRSVREAAQRVVDRAGVVPPDPALLLSQLSGGNQQKALLGKWLELAPRVLLLHEPAQGVDVLAKHDIFVQIEQAAATGIGVVIASAEYEDLAHLCHRVIVLEDGVVVATLVGDAISVDRITELAYAAQPAASVADGAFA